MGDHYFSFARHGDDECQAILADVLSRHGIGTPDGRPLYAYRPASVDLDSLLLVLRSDPSRIAIEHPNNCAALCLVAANAFCRDHRSGPWSWAPLWTALGLHLDVQAKLHPALDRGLRWWGVPLLRTRASRRFLTTIAVQGGLPRQLLAAGASGGALGAYLAQVLRLHERFPDVALVELARQHRQELPPTLRQEELFELVAALVGTVARLRRLAGDAEDPVAALDALRPAWRDELPLHFDDGAAERLVGGLLREPSAESPRIGSPSLGLWLQLGSNPRLIRAPCFPAVLPAIELWDGDPPPLLDLLLRPTGSYGTRLWRRLGQAWRGADGQHFDLDLDDELELPESPLLLGQWVLVASAPGRTEQERPLRGGEDLGGAPWAFEAPGEDGRARLAGVGSARTRGESLIVALPSCAQPGEGEWQPAGRLADCNRELWILTSDSEVELEGERFALRVSSSRIEEYRLMGRLAPIGTVDRAAWLGPPRLRCRSHPDGIFDDLPEHELQWRSEGGGPWLPARDALGCGVLRHIRHGVTLHRDFLCVLPADLSMRCGASRHAGRDAGETIVESAGLLAMQVHPSDTLDLVVAGEPGRYAVTALRRGAALPSDESLLLRAELRNGGAVELVAPLPVPLAAFVDESGAPPDSTSVTPRHLARLRAVVVGASATDRPTVTIAPEDRPTDILAERSLPETLWGRFEVSLRDLEPLADELLPIAGGGSELDGGLRLTMIVDGQEVQRLYVRAYSHLLDPARGGALIDAPRVTVRAVVEHGGANIEAEGLEAVAIPTWRPGAEPIVLDRGGDGFVLEGGRLHPGWWVVHCTAREGNVVVRPRAYEAPTLLDRDPPLPELAPRSRLEYACRLPFESSIDAIGSELDAMALGTEAECIQCLVEASDALLRCPPPTFRTFVALARRPAACARLALELSRAETLQAVWRAMGGLEFTWHCVPLTAWRAAVEAFLGQAAEITRSEFLSASLGELVRRIAPRNPYLRVVATEVRRALGYPCEPDDASRLARIDVHHPILIQELERLRDQLRRDHAHEVERRGLSVWPQLPVAETARRLEVEPAVRDLAMQAHLRQTRPLLDAPGLAAACAVACDELDPAVVRIVKRARAFDREWFDGAFPLQLARASVIHRAS